jgi:hypothetical protein
VTRWVVTATWQFAVLPREPVYWRATPADSLPHLGKPVSSNTTASGRIRPAIRRAIAARTGTGSQVESVRNCCSDCRSPSGNRAAIGSTDFRSPSSISPRRYTSPQNR